MSLGFKRLNSSHVLKPSPSLRPTQPPTQWSSGVLFLRIKRPERECGHSTPCNTSLPATCRDYYTCALYRPLSSYCYFWLQVYRQMELSGNEGDNPSLVTAVSSAYRYTLSVAMLFDTLFACC